MAAPNPPERIRTLLNALGALGGRADARQLLDHLRAHGFPGLRHGPLERMVAAAEAGGWVRRDGDVIAVRDTTAAAAPPPEIRAIRAVAVDLETLVRTVGDAPYLERAIREIGAVRFGHDDTWVAAHPTLRVDVTVPARFAPPTTPEGAVPIGDALDALDAISAGCDVIVTYNGTALDIPVLRDAYETCGRAMPDFEHADLLPVAHTLWPLARDHRLATICRIAGVAEGRWHHADADARATADLAAAAAAHLTQRGAGLRDVVLAVTRTSPTWRLVADLGHLDEPAPFDADTVAAILDAEITRPAVRAGAPASAAATFAAPATWRDATGRIDATALAVALRPDARRRAGQEAMQDALRGAAQRGHNIAVEAPTGTGKSLVVLADALNWINSAPNRVAIIATHTKALQGQLATDVERLAATCPGLAGIATVAKGAANRLSVRALTVGLADASQRTRRPRRGRAAHPAYGELLAFLTLRFIVNPIGLVDDWEIRSVDTSDVPACFDELSGGRWRSWLADLSQANADEIDATETLGGHTRSTAEHLAASRLVIANHALVFAHLDHLLLNGDDTLVIADEAHTLESAATDAFSARLETPALEAAVARTRNAAGVLGAPFTGIADGLESMLDNEILHRTAMAAVDALAGAPPGHGDTHPRSAALASDYTGGRGRGAVRSIVGELGRLARRLDGARRLTAGYVAANASTLPPAQRSQVFDLLARFSTLADAAARVVSDVDGLWGTDHLSPPPPRPARVTAAGAASATSAGDDLEAQSRLGGTQPPPGQGTAPASDGPGDDLEADTGDNNSDADDADDAADADTDGDADEASGSDSVDVDASPVDAVPARSNRVVIIAELPGSDLAAGSRGYRFAVTTAPVRLGAEARWQDFLGGFSRIVLTSATLTIAGDWDFLEQRLDVTSPRWDRVVVPGPFDWARQARLCVFEDFPSWVEQPDGAIRTTAHQLAGYAAVTNAAGNAPAALVLTTSTSAAGAITERLAATMGAAGTSTAIWPAPIHGNRRAVELHRNNGGILIGTKGLWAGVDIDDPARVRLVWINKLPFPPFADPLIATRRAEVAATAEAAGHPDPDSVASETYYLPLAALELRQGVGRLLRSEGHHGAVIVSDRRLAGTSALRRSWRRILLGSLDPGLNIADPVTGEAWAGNVMPMAQAWRRIFEHYATCNHIDPAQLAELCDPDRLETHIWSPETLAVRAARLDDTAADDLRRAGRYATEVADRAETVARNLRYNPTLTLDPTQRDAIIAAAAGADVLGLLATGFGKSFCYQLPALIEPGLTVVVSPLVALMVDQALDLNRVAGGAVRALVGPMRESVSRAGRQDLADQLEGRADHGIKLVYLSPERLAQRTVREWLAAGVAAGRVRRLVFDEAHTLVQWGDDFRPSYRRLAAHLRELHAAHPDGRLPISAFTATANRTVRTGLAELLYAGVPAATVDDAGPGTLVTLSGEPLRPELAIYRRQMRGAGTVTLARMVESLVDTTTDHTIIYATTVRQVETTWAHLRAYVGDADAPRIRRFHGRLPEAEKADVLAAFKAAPTRAEADAAQEPFAPLIIVATSAFGLGIDRRDVRCVISMTPPTDLAALYQQLGRAGRDARGSVPDDVADANVAIALATGQGFRTVEWLTRDLPERVLDAAGRRVLRCGGVLDADRVAGDLINADLAAGHLSVEHAAKQATVDAYRAGVMRALATLVDAGAVEDLGDFPTLARIRPGAAPAGDALDASLAARAAAGGAIVDVAALHRDCVTVTGCADDPAGFWAQIVDAHHRGIIDASCATGRWCSAVGAFTATLPAGWSDRIRRRSARARDEITALRAWYADSARCANAGFADYFAPAGTGTVPAACCSTAATRCTTCQAREPGAAPALLDALLHPRPRRDGPTVDDGRLDRAIAILVRDQHQGLGVGLLRKVLRGEDTYYDTRAGQRRPLRSRLLRHRLFGAFPGLRDAAIIASLDRLAAADLVTLDATSGRWRHRDALAADARVAARSPRSTT